MLPFSCGYWCSQTAVHEKKVVFYILLEKRKPQPKTSNNGRQWKYLSSGNNTANNLRYLVSFLMRLFYLSWLHAFIVILLSHREMDVVRRSMHRTGLGRGANSHSMHMKFERLELCIPTFTFAKWVFVFMYGFSWNINSSGCSICIYWSGDKSTFTPWMKLTWLSENPVPCDIDVFGFWWYSRRSYYNM